MFVRGHFLPFRNVQLWHWWRSSVSSIQHNFSMSIAESNVWSRLKFEISERSFDAIIYARDMSYLCSSNFMKCYKCTPRQLPTTFTSTPMNYKTTQEENFLFVSFFLFFFKFFLKKKEKYFQFEPTINCINVPMT